MDRYAEDPLSTNWRRPKDVPSVHAELDLVVEVTQGGFCGAIVGVEKGPGGHTVTLEDRLNRRRVFPLGYGFEVDGKAVLLLPPQQKGPVRPTRTASGSVAPPTSRARVAVGSRIYVEGRHDAELVEKVWGDDLRVEGVVVEYLEGVDHLAAIVAEFAPTRDRRLGVLVDHLVEGSKEWRIAAQVSSPHVLIVGHPYIDIWQAVKPNSVGIRAWPTIPPGRPWKEGVLEALGWYVEPHSRASATTEERVRSPSEIGIAWKRILGGVRSWNDLEPELLGRVEEVIDFVSAPSP